MGCAGYIGEDDSWDATASNTNSQDTDDDDGNDDDDDEHVKMMWMMFRVFDSNENNIYMPLNYWLCQ